MTKRVKLSINFESANDAFQGEPYNEIFRILADITNTIDQGPRIKSIYDLNGNSIGFVELFITEE